MIFIHQPDVAPVDRYRDTLPVLRPSVFFNGPLEAQGIIQDRKGKVLRRFSAQLIGRWEGQTGQLDETFIFDDGETQHRCWHLEESDHTLIGTAGDVEGEAKGLFSGSALHWRYTLVVQMKRRTINISLDDRMYLVDDHCLINRTKMYKFGVRVGEIIISIRKR